MVTIVWLIILYYAIVLAELQELKWILDDWIKEKEVCSGCFSAKPRIESSPSTLAIPINPVQWAVKKWSWDLIFFVLLQLVSALLQAKINQRMSSRNLYLSIKQQGGTDPWD